MIQAEDIIRELPIGLIGWYEFTSGARAVCITDEKNQKIAVGLEERGLFVDTYCVEKDSRLELQDNTYNYAIVAGGLERAKDTKLFLQVIRQSMKKDGILLLATDNRLGIRYFCGDQDAFTGKNFDSIENYLRVSFEKAGVEGRTYAKHELQDMLADAGFTRQKFYSVFPQYQCPQIMFSQDYEPKEQLDIRIFPQYECKDTLFLEEDLLYQTLVENQLLHPMANGFFVECPLQGEFAPVNQVTMSMERGRKQAMFTILRKDETVHKLPVFKEGFEKIEGLLDSNAYLTQHGIRMVETNVTGNGVDMPYIHEITALEYLRTLVLKDTEAFIHELDKLWELILQSSEHVPEEEIDWDEFVPYWGEKKPDDPFTERYIRHPQIGCVLKRGYIDLVPLNCFYFNGEYVFYDQELYVENLPAKVIMLRTIDTVYRGQREIYQTLPYNDLMERYQLEECKPLFQRFVGKFLSDLRNDSLLKEYHKRVRKDVNVIKANRQRMNYSADTYDKVFRDVFKGIGNRDLYLFGSGLYAEKFMEQYGDEYKVVGIIDNNSEKWGTNFQGIPIYGVEHLFSLENGTYKVMVCIKSFIPVMKQLQELGIGEFSVFDPEQIYPRWQRQTVSLTSESVAEKKKYHVGYIAGVFDLYHIGHLNMFKRAKELCDYLIVGVVTDEGVMLNKKVKPFVPFEERLELVASCQYVDEAVEIPLHANNTDEAYRRYQFDVQFSGSDYEQDEAWLAKRDYLRERGSDMVFFPYTEKTSSTKIKALINQSLL